MIRKLMSWGHGKIESLTSPKAWGKCKKYFKPIVDRGKSSISSMRPPSSSKSQSEEINLYNPAASQTKTFIKEKAVKPLTEKKKTPWFFSWIQSIGKSFQQFFQAIWNFLKSPFICS